MKNAFLDCHIFTEYNLIIVPMGVTSVVTYTFSIVYRFIIWFTVVEVGDLCRLGWQGQARDGYLRLTIGYLKATVFTLGKH